VRCRPGEELVAVLAVFTELMADRLRKSGTGLGSPGQPYLSQARFEMLAAYRETNVAPVGLRRAARSVVVRSFGRSFDAAACS
jgi:hypothetical protein